MISIAENKDCMEAMKEFPDGFFDLAIVDPPFFKGAGKGNVYGSGLSGTGRKRGVYKNLNSWDNNIPDNGYYQELLRVSKHQIIWGINYFTDFKDVPVGRLIWDKKNDDSTFSNCEIASCSLISSVQIFRYLWCGFLQENIKNKEKRFHKTQKPTAIYRWSLKKYAKPGDKILDTHLGSGSSRIAAHDMGFDFWSYEIDANCFKSQEKRFKQHTAQLTLI